MIGSDSRLNWVVRMIAVGSEVTVYRERRVYVCFLRNVPGASLFTQDPLHIFGRDKSGVGKLKREKRAGWGLKLSQAEMLRLYSCDILYSCINVELCSPCACVDGVNQAWRPCLRALGLHFFFTIADWSGGSACAVLLLGDTAAFSQSLFLLYPVHSLCPSLCALVCKCVH